MMYYYLRENMEKNDMIEKFLNKQLLNVPSTRKNYRINIQSYFKLLNKDMNEYFNNGYTPDDCDNDLRQVYTILDKRGKGDLSKRTFFNSIKQFMASNNKELKNLDFWDLLKNRTRGCEPESDEAILNAADIKKILSHGNACSRSLFLMLASSGRRISEILALTPDDVNTNVTPTTINITKGLDRNTTKTRQKTICFISDEATESYKAWLKERPLYLEDAIKRAAGKNKDPNDPRIFPMTYSNAIAIWSTLLMKSGVVEIEHVKAKGDRNGYRKIKRKHKGDRVMAHPHCLRKFFISYLGDYHYADYLAGHSTIMKKTYDKKTKEDRAEDYKKLMPNVTIFSHAPDLSGINESLKEKDEQIKDLQKQLNDLNKALGFKDYLEKVIEEKVNGKKKKD